MRAALLAGLLLAGNLATPAHALVGPSTSGDFAAPYTVMVLNRAERASSFCTGVVLSDRIVLTAAHCVYKAQDVAIYAPDGQSGTLHPVQEAQIHPEFTPDAIRLRKRSVDLALLRTQTPLPRHQRPAMLSAHADVREGDGLRIAGFGVRREGDEKTAGQLRSAELVVRAPLGSILVWLRGRDGARAGACTGDSGGPVFAAATNEVVAITVWARGDGKRRCGTLTQGVFIAPQRAWIDSILRRWSPG